MPDRVSVYIDGFNLYFGLRQSQLQRFYWLDVKKLALALLRTNQELADVKYFTSRISGPSDKQQRQSLFIQATETLPGVTIYYGQYRTNQQTCRRCGAVTPVPTEKMTDVNIAVEMMRDAHKHSYDIAILVSGDSDLTAPIKAVQEVFSRKVIIAFPPNRVSAALRAVATASTHIGTGKLASSQFDEQVTTRSGFIISRPPTWR